MLNVKFGVCYFAYSQLVTQMLNGQHHQMLKKLRPSWHNTTQKATTTLKAEAPAAGATLQRLGGGRPRKKTKWLSYLRFKALFLVK